MPQVIHLIRHGSHAEVGRILSGRSEIALDDTGRREAASLVACFEGEPLASLHSSPRRRARETASPLVRDRGLAVTIAPELDEIDFGGFTGRSFAALDPDPAWRRWNAERDTARCPGGETMGEATARALAYLRAMPPSLTPALCVTHCDIIRGIVARILDLSFDRMFQLACDPGSVTTLVWMGEAVRLDRLNARVRPPAPA